MIMPRYAPFGFPWSRDWGMTNVPCKCTDCLANRNNSCEVPSLIQIGADGTCETGKKYIEEKQCKPKESS